MSAEVDYLLTLAAVRERANHVHSIAESRRLNHFNYDASRMQDAADFVLNVISVGHLFNAGTLPKSRYHEIPPHGRWQHFNIGGVDRVADLLREAGGAADAREQTRLLVDLFFVSVLLDAGAGHEWQFSELGTGQKYGRSEGIAVASLYMFRSGSLSSNPHLPLRVDGQKLSALEEQDFLSAFQVRPGNSMPGIESRLQLLRRFGKSLLNLPDVFGSEGRPGNLVDYLLHSTAEPHTLDYALLWEVLQNLLIPAWPSTRTTVRGRPVGDAWPLEVLGGRARNSSDSVDASTIQPFHKLTQWLAYSLAVPFERLLGLSWANMEFGTGLAEYRNGGLFVDLQVLTLKETDLAIGLASSGTDLPQFSATGDVIVEWRAMTVALLDRLYQLISERLRAQGVNLSMAQMLEAGTWKSGRELAAIHRPLTKSSPILIDGDGTLF